MNLSAKAGWDEFVNDSGSVIPARGIVRVKDVVILAPGRIQLKVDRPNSYGDVGNCFVVGPTQVGIGKYGSCTRTDLSGVVTALYDYESGIPEAGQTWGPAAGSFKMSRSGTGWISLGAPVNTTRHLSLFVAAKAGFSCTKIRFQVTSENTNSRSVIARVIAVPAGFAIADVPDIYLFPDFVQVCDSIGCYFNETPGSLVGREGFAEYMQPLYTTPCQPNGYYPFTPQWEVSALCCSTAECN